MNEAAICIGSVEDFFVKSSVQSSFQPHTTLGMSRLEKTVPGYSVFKNRPVSEYSNIINVMTKTEFIPNKISPKPQTSTLFSKIPCYFIKSRHYSSQMCCLFVVFRQTSSWFTER